VKVDGPIVSNDVGQHQMWAAQYLCLVAPRRLPDAIGAQICCTGSALDIPVFLIITCAWPPNN